MAQVPSRISSRTATWDFSVEGGASNLSNLDLGIAMIGGEAWTAFRWHTNIPVTSPNPLATINIGFGFIGIFFPPLDLATINGSGVLFFMNGLPTYPLAAALAPVSNINPFPLLFSSSDPLTGGQIVFQFDFIEMPMP